MTPDRGDGVLVTGVAASGSEEYAFPGKAAV